MNRKLKLQTEADNSVIQTWGIFGSVETDKETGRERVDGNLILLSNVFGKFEYPELRRLAQDMYKEYNPDVCVIEKKASGQSLIQDMRRTRIPVLEYMPDRDKVSRVYAASPFMEAGKVWIPNTEWAEALYDEAIQFPNAAHDDMVDCMTMAIIYMRDSWNLIHPEDAANDDFEYSNTYKKRKRAYWRV
ncbi:MAG: phage terminase large subunit [Pelagibacteraceae bacterium]